MASLAKAINKDLFDKILPTFGNPRVHVPVWDEGQKMFLCEEYESGNGHRYYKGVILRPYCHCGESGALPHLDLHRQH